MKIEYRTPAGAGGYTVLVDESDAGDATGPRITKFRVRPVGGPPQEDNLAFAATGAVEDTGNTRWEMAFVIERTHASPDAAASYLATHGGVRAAMVPRANIDIKVTVGATVLTLAHAAVRQWEPNENPDKSTVFNYNFLGRTYS